MRSFLPETLGVKVEWHSIKTSKSECTANSVGWMDLTSDLRVQGRVSCPAWSREFLGGFLFFWDRYFEVFSCSDIMVWVKLISLLWRVVSHISWISCAIYWTVETPVVFSYTTDKSLKHTEHNKMSNYMTSCLNNSNRTLDTWGPQLH